VKAFSYISPEFDESRYIEATVEATGAELHRVEPDAGRLWERLDEVLWHHDEPLHSATALIGFEIYRLAAANGVKVALTGQGADETIGGYPSYFVDHWRDLVRGAAPRAAWREIDAYCARHPDDRWKLFRQILVQSAKQELSRLPLARLAASRRSRRRTGASPWFTADLVRALAPEEHATGAGSLDTALRRSVETGSLPLYLRIEDRNSMAHSVEARLPFLDYRLVSLAFGLPAAWKLRGPWNKYVLREAMRGWLPEVVRTRPDKMGFPTSVGSWFRGAFYEALQDTLASAVTRTRGIYDVRSIRIDLERHHRGEIDIGAELFNVAQVERWLDGRPSRVLARA
jgi:asparagine synthase (glutamine-hydrolysing)